MAEPKKDWLFGPLEEAGIVEVIRAEDGPPMLVSVYHCQRCGGLFGAHGGLCYNCAHFLELFPSPPSTCAVCGKVWPWHGGRCPECRTPIPYYNANAPKEGEA